VVAGERAVRLSALRRLYELIGRVNGGRGLRNTLQAVVDGVVDGLGFGVAVVNMVHADGAFETVAVAGPEDARRQLLGVRSPADAFELEFQVAEDWGGLRFVPHDRIPEGAAVGWVPPVESCDAHAPDAWHPLDALFAPLRAPDGTLVGMLSVDLPHDGRRPGPLHRELLEMFAAQAGVAIDNARLAEQLYASEEAFRLAFEGASTGMSMISLDPSDPGRFLRVNDALCAITGYSAPQLMARTFADITHPDDRAPDEAAFIRALSTTDHGAYRAEKRYIRPDGTVVWVQITTSVVRLASGELLYGLTQVEDISARRAAEEELRHRAAHDPLTGLANRATLTEALTHALQGTRGRSGRSRAAVSEAADRYPGAVLFCDLDDFKPVNDTHGHDVGDAVLRVVAARLREQVRPQDLVARLGGDEFVVLAEGVDVSEAQRLAERLGESVAAPIAVDEATVAVTVSIGITALSAHFPDVPAVLRAADAAMYEAKTTARTIRSASQRAVSSPA
jgi:diguanylate cyclase (GGDEF)-like protein/PAS domain S-box-containing protein